ncbi:restriction endonuclease S subunit [Desulfocurvibacter africanus PCS]|uniref:Restriction endonuclease S subunit n=1 Tax=Desulfocurvibacter africanus PCS TaxID=1262666 RepID=M5PRY5_DESAF|nr:restriction endonuclease subunit S [Desulfocurvibacter africanus]EMG37152.1 restriction endonuclease S subunit [Desulfocurvibacter africanus PCS]
MAAINHVMLSDAVANNRFSAEFFDPQYVYKPKNSFLWAPIGRVLKKCEYGISISMNTKGTGFPIFRMNELNNCFALRPEKFAEISQQRFEQYRLKENDVLFNRTNSFEYVGRTGLVKDQTDCTFASYLIRLVPDNSVVLPEYLAVYLNTKFGIGQIKRRAMRSINQANVSGSEVKKILIPLFDTAAQENIAELVNAAYRLSKESEVAYTQAQHLLESELGLDKLRFDKSTGYMARFSVVGLTDNFEAGRIDAQCFSPEAVYYEDWLLKHATCDRLSTLLASTAKGRQQAEAETGIINYCSIKHISDREIVSASKTTPSLGTPNAIKGDLLLAITGATIGKVGIVNRYENLTFSGDMLRLRVNNEISPHYLLLALDHRLGQVQFNRWITGSTNGHLAPRDVGRILVPRLTAAVEQQISTLVAESLKKRQESEQLLAQAKSRVEQLIEEAVQS